MRYLTILAVLLSSSIASAADHPLAGTWKLLSVTTEVVATGEKIGGWGPNSHGLMSIQADGKSFTVMVPEDPKMPLNANASTHRLTGEAQTTIHRELAANSPRTPAPIRSATSRSKARTSICRRCP